MQESNKSDKIDDIKIYGDGIVYAITFDMEVSKLKEFYGEPYNKAYDEIKIIMRELGFEWTQGSLYVSKESQQSMALIYKAIEKLKSIKWFSESVRDIRAFEVNAWSDFTDIVKGN